MKLKRFLIISGAGYTIGTADTLAEAKEFQKQFTFETHIFDSTKAFQ